MEDLKDRYGNVVYRIEGNRIYDMYGSWKYEIRGNRIYDTYSAWKWEIRDDGYIYDIYGKRLCAKENLVDLLLASEPDEGPSEPTYSRPTSSKSSSGELDISTFLLGILALIAFYVAKYTFKAWLLVVRANLGGKIGVFLGVALSIIIGIFYIGKGTGDPIVIIVETFFLCIIGPIIGATIGAIVNFIIKMQKKYNWPVGGVVGVVLGLFAAAAIAIFIQFNKNSASIARTDTPNKYSEPTATNETQPTEKSPNESKTFVDPRDKKTYNTITIGTQTWIAENLNYEMKGSECYDHNPENCRKYGRLYHWEPALKACPSGWHLPKDSEWETLANFIGSNAGRKLKAKSGWDSNGTDEYGFSALPSGTGKSDGTFIMLGSYGYWWSIGEGTDAYYRYISSENNNLNKIKSTKKGLFPIRCLQD